jgi:uncharacterized protein (DUF885 family)
VVIAVGACSSYPPDLTVAPAATAPTAAATAPVQNADELFQGLAARFLDRYLELRPVKATELGDHRFDGRWPLLGEAGERAQRGLVAQTRGELERIEPDKLSAQHRVDRAILSDRLDRWVFELDELRPWHVNPLEYTNLLGDGLDPLVNREFAPLATRMESLRQRLQTVSSVVAAAKATLERPPRIHTETAIQQVAGLVSFVEGHLPAVFARVPEQKAALDEAAASALASLRELQAFLEQELLPRSDGDFRLGAARFDKKLRYVLDSDEPASALVAGARAMLSQTRAEMVDTAVELWPELFPRRKTPDRKKAAGRAELVRSVLARLAEDRPTNETIVDEARKLTREATEFVRAKNLVEVPDEPISVIEMPEYRRGVAVAYCDSAGPLEKSRQTFYAISPTPKDWSPARATSFYREYNRAMLAELTIHEAMPGHALQLAHASRFVSPIRAVFESGPFIEGWAVYSEAIMAKHGFGGARVRIQRQKMALRVAANAILDHEVHAGSMGEEEAMKLLTEEVYQEEGEAAGKWRRVQLTSVQLSTYYFGFAEVSKLRKRAERQPGFSERAFHDRLLAYGSPAPKYLRHILFEDPLD